MTYNNKNILTSPTSTNTLTDHTAQNGLRGTLIMKTINRPSEIVHTPWLIHTGRNSTLHRHTINGLNLIVLLAPKNYQIPPKQANLGPSLTKSQL